jgi:AcrR family transcriptional regulator
MSKATFYEHFSNKEECIIALFDRASEVVASGIAEAARGPGRGDAAARMHAATRAYLSVVAEYPEFAQTLLVEIIGAGPEVAARRDEMLRVFAELFDAENAAAAARGLIPRFASPHDAYALVGAVFELVSRHLRLGIPSDVMELAPVIDRLADGLLAQS